MIKLLFFVLIIVTSSLNLLQASVIFQHENRIVTQKVPLSQCFGMMMGQKELLKEVVELSWDKYSTKIAPFLRSQSAFDRDMSIEDIEAHNEQTQMTVDSVELANTFVEMLEKDQGATDKVDISEAFPDAIMIFAGSKGSGGGFFKGGYNGNLAIVMMPYCVRSYDLSYNTQPTENDTPISSSIDFESSIVFYGGGSVGIGAGAGLKGRFGVGAIWSLDQRFNKPEEFAGYYGGRSCSKDVDLFKWKPQRTIKYGFVKRLETNFYPDFFMYTYGIEVGKSAQIGCNWNFNGIFPLSTVKGWFDGAIEDEYNRHRSETEDQQREAFINLINNLKEKQEAEGSADEEEIAEEIE